jgi:hypothetical protein
VAMQRPTRPRATRMTCQHTTQCIEKIQSFIKSLQFHNLSRNSRPWDFRFIKRSVWRWQSSEMLCRPFP